MTTQLVRALMEKDRRNHISVLDSTEVRDLLGIALSSDDEGDRGVARETVEWLVARGHGEFAELVGDYPDSPRL